MRAPRQSDAHVRVDAEVLWSEVAESWVAEWSLKGEMEEVSIMIVF